MMSRTAKLSITWLIGLIIVIVLPHIVGIVYTNVLVTFMMDSVFALSVNLLLGFTGLLSFGQAMFFGVGGYAAALALTHIPGFPLMGVIFVSGFAGFILSCIVAPVLCRITGTAFAMLTLAFGMLTYVICLKFREITGGEDGIVGFDIPPLNLGFTSIDICDPTNFYYFALVVLGVVAFFMWWLVKTPFGTVLISIRDNAQRADYLGYQVKHSKALVIIISGTMAGFVGGVYALFHNLVSTDGALTVFVSFTPLMASYIGGVGNFVGPIVGSGILHILDELTSRFTERVDLVNGIVFIIVVMYAPMGAVGAWWSIQEWFLKKIRKAQEENS
ncbi:MAG: branched-chain amino acid ABC transporter permease [Deltaproteobacteria bacterium]|nr:branched-chain amino acid ABC transporter permease [Deltaproteobacteria bacterium]